MPWTCDLQLGGTGAQAGGRWHLAVQSGSRLPDSHTQPSDPRLGSRVAQGDSGEEI